MEKPAATVRLRVEGLDCADCAARLEKALNGLPGVVGAAVGFATGTLRLEYDPERLDLDDAAEAAGKLGYRVAVPGHREEHDHDERDHDDHEHHGHVHDRVELTEEHEHEEASPFPVLIGAVGILLGFLLERMGISWYWASFVVAATVAGYPVAREGVETLLAGAGADINLLTSVAGVGALALGQWSEAAAVLTLFSVGEYLEERASDRARKSIRELMDLSPRTARLKRGEDLTEVPVDQIKPGDAVVVFPGERISADGNVRAGESAVNQAPITGESVPVDKGPGDQVYAGSINGEGALEVIATRTAEDTTIARIVSMVEDAQSRKAKSQRLVDSFARYWTPAMMGLSVLVAFGVPLALRAPFRPWVYRGLTVLIVSCPCSLVISTPVTVVAAIARAARNGVLIKGGIHLEDLGKVRAVAFDKTGTITKGQIQVDEIVPAPGRTAEEVLLLAAAGEARSEHPLAKAVLDAARARGVAFDAGEHFVSLRGKGAKARVGDHNVYVGNPLLFDEAEIEVPPDMAEQARESRALGRTVIYVGSGSSLSGFMGLSDTVREESRTALDRLRKAGLNVTMLTGDEEPTARAVAERTGIESFRAGLLPGDKQTAIAGMKEEFSTVAMVGDGINDAPSLAAANVGIAMGQGADVALETADVALLTNDLGKVAWSVELGRRARSLIVENVGFSVAVKLAALLLVLGGVLPLWLAVLADSGAAVAVTLNGLRVLAFK